MCGYDVAVPERDESQQHTRCMQLAARLAWRGHGLVEPNPMVGCVITNAPGGIVGTGWHRRFGEAHAEVNALRDAGGAARGGTCYVTLEPCDHQGKTGPCSAALIAAGVARVIIARRDPNPEAAGGAMRLRDAGVTVAFRDDLLPGIAPADPFAHRVKTSLPWVIAKWAQTLDGRIATRMGESQWISSPRSRRAVHRKRGRVDAILTGIGTVLADDPLLTARGVRARRVARRVVYDPKLQIPMQSQLVQTARDVPVTVCCMDAMAHSSHAQALRDASVDVIGIELSDDSTQAMRAMLIDLVQRYDMMHVLVESGPGLLGRLFSADAVNEAWVFIAPLLLGDEQAKPAVRGLTSPRLADGKHMQLIDHRARGGDVMTRWLVSR